MKILRLRGNPNIYTCNPYLVLGSWNRLEDINCLVDVGTDGSILDEIANIATGVGKKAVARVILTHGHFDHAGGLRAVVDRYHPEVLAAARSDFVTRLLRDGESVRMGDRAFDVIFAPGHSNDSVCLFEREERVLFAGDNPVRVRVPGGSYSSAWVAVLERLVDLKVRTIYTGHDDIITPDGADTLAETLRNVRKSQIVA